MKIKNYLTYLLTFLLIGLFSCKDEKPNSVTGTNNPPVAATGNPAIDGLSQQLQNDPNNAALYASRAGAWYENENYDEGISDLEKAISLDSTKAEYYHVLADMYMDYYKSRMALNTMEKAASAFPKRIPTLLKLSEFQLILQQHRESLFTLERIRAIDPQNSEMFFMFGNVFRDMGRTEEAINAYQSAVENDPELVDAWFLLGDLLAEKNVQLAEKYYDNALRVDSNNVEAIKAKARYLANKKNDLDGAVVLYKKINTIAPQYEEGYYDIGLIYLDMDSLEQAYKSFDIAVNIAPQFAEAYFHRGVAAEMQGNNSQAVSDYQNTLNLDPDFAGAQAGLRRLGQ